MIRVTVWNEYRHEKMNPRVAEVYPEGIHNVIAGFLEKDGRFEARTATLDEPENGLPDEVLESTDVLIWWGHKAHAEVLDSVAQKVQKRVQAGMGFIALHSAHLSKPFKLLMGTTCTLRWRKAGEKERLWNIAPAHPITQGVGDYFELEHTEMYGEYFDIPKPDENIFLSWFAGGEVFRSGCVWNRGNGKVFYFKPGHETFPIYYNETIRKIICNAAAWCAPASYMERECIQVEPIEPIDIIEC